MVRATAIGWRAHAALRASGGHAKLVAPLTRSVYADAAGELIWVGPAGTPLHARVVRTLDPPSANDSLFIEVGDLTAWRGPLPGRPHASVSTAAHAVRRELATLGVVRGWARLLGDDRDDDVVL